MRPSARPALAALLAPLAWYVAGCSSGSSPDPVSGPLGEGVKIQEYVGDGHGGTKSWPALLPQAGEAEGPPAALSLQPVQTQARPTPLADNTRRAWSYVPRAAVNWFAVEFAAARWVVTLQPTTNVDTDLYLLDGSAPTYTDGAGCFGSSTRVPQVSDHDRVKGSYAPDWVYFQIGGNRNAPACFAAVYGPDAETERKVFTIEADRAIALPPNLSSYAASLRVGDSRWFWFMTQRGEDYTVRLTASEGDPDLYVYRAFSDQYLTGSAARGGAEVSFTAEFGSLHLIRVYAYTDCRYGIRALSP